MNHMGKSVSCSRLMKKEKVSCLQSSKHLIRLLESQTGLILSKKQPVPVQRVYVLFPTSGLIHQLQRPDSTMPDFVLDYFT